MTSIEAEGNAAVRAVESYLGRGGHGMTLEASPDDDGLWFVAPTLDGEVGFGGTVYYVQLATGRVVEVSGSLPPGEQVAEARSVLGLD